MADSSGALFAAFVSVSDELNALSPDNLVAITFDAPHAISVIVGAFPALLIYREPLAALPGFKLDRFNLIPTYASAATHIQANYTKTAKRDPEETARLKLGIKLRGNYRTDMASLIRRGHVAKSRVAEVPKETSFGGVGFGLVGMSNIFRENWSVIGTKVPFTLAELDASDVLAQELIAIDSRIGVHAKSQTALMRRRCLTLLVNAYSEAMRGLTYLLWEDPKLRAELLPSFHTKNGRGNAAKAKVAKQETPPGGPPLPVVAPEGRVEAKP